VKGLKAVNDDLGHDMGDELLRETVAAIKVRLRSYDVITRVGGDEFVCSLSGQDVAGATERFDQIALRLADGKTCGSFRVGFAKRGKNDSLDDLMRRADKAMRRGPAEARRPGA
jgi:diguanylate cyclase (GGDEF)-like protein